MFLCGNFKSKCLECFLSYVVWSHLRTLTWNCSNECSSKLNKLLERTPLQACAWVRCCIWQTCNVIDPADRATWTDGNCWQIAWLPWKPCHFIFLWLVFLRMMRILCLRNNSLVEKAVSTIWHLGTLHLDIRGFYCPLGSLSLLPDISSFVLHSSVSEVNSMMMCFCSKAVGMLASR